MSYPYWSDGTDTGIQMRAGDKGRTDSLIVMVQGDRRDSIAMYDLLLLIPSSGARHRVRAGWGMTVDQYREAFNVERAEEVIRLDSLDEFTTAYIECALWSTYDNSNESGGEPLDANYGPEDIAPATLARMVDDCNVFRLTEGALLAKAGTDAQNGHDFWLTREGHGAGFWDRGYGTVGDKLTKVCKAYGSFDLTVYDGKINH